jgi:hypothetical protein
MAFTIPFPTKVSAASRTVVRVDPPNVSNNVKSFLVAFAFEHVGKWIAVDRRKWNLRRIRLAQAYAVCGHRWNSSCVVPRLFQCRPSPDTESTVALYFRSIPTNIFDLQDTRYRRPCLQDVALRYSNSRNPQSWAAPGRALPADEFCLQEHRFRLLSHHPQLAFVNKCLEEKALR